MSTREYSLWLKMMETCQGILDDLKLSNEVNEGETMLIFGDESNKRPLDPDDFKALLELKFRSGEVSGANAAANRFLEVLNEWNVDLSGSP